MSRQYHTIDPLILETLNLNQQRMNTILDILHGRTPQKYAKTQRKIQNKSMMRKLSPEPQNQQEHNLPRILLNKQKKTQKLADLPQVTLEPKPVRTQRPSIKRNRSSEIVLSQTEEPKPQPRIRSYKKVEEKIAEKKQTEVLVEKKRPSTLQFQVSSGDKIVKQRQLLIDYKVEGLRRVKSGQINPKDVYRMQIEGLVGELTAIEDLQQAQKKMNRLKRRHKHLCTFDKQYFLKLNQHDMFILS